MLSRLISVVLCLAFSSIFIVAQYATQIPSSPACVESSSCPTTTTMILARQDTTEPPQPSNTQTLALFGLAMYPNVNFQGEVTNYFNASVNDSIPLGASYQIFNSTWASMNSPSANNTIIIWDSAPNVSNLPISTSQDYAITEIQSSLCSPPCTGSGVCSLFGFCLCFTGFNGTLCEECANGFFGPTCQPCPSNCTNCDQGISGTGSCLDPGVNTTVPGCASQNQCTCPPGYNLNNNGTACTECQQGFYLASPGSCEICNTGCAECADGQGNCISCKTGFTQDPDNAAKCAPLNKLTNGTICGPQSYPDGQTCVICSSECQTCTGPSPNDCVKCASNGNGSNGGGIRSLFNDSCVAVNTDGVCEGTNGMIANNDKLECESCGAVTPNCASCNFSNFGINSTLNDAQCTGCSPGYLLFNGTCVQTCPSGTFRSQDNDNSSSNSTLSCTRCSSESNCSTCTGSPDFCLTCTTGFAFAGKCSPTCPHGTFPLNNACASCHPDCGTCEGPSFQQCLSCSQDLPVLSSGRCLPTCNNKSQFFNTATSTCQQCDPSCSSCSGSGSNQCLACQDPSQFVLQAGVCELVPTLGGRGLPVQNVDRNHPIYTIIEPV